MCLSDFYKPKLSIGITGNMSKLKYMARTNPDERQRSLRCPLAHIVLAQSLHHVDHGMSQTSEKVWNAVQLFCPLSVKHIVAKGFWHDLATRRRIEIVLIALADNVLHLAYLCLNLAAKSSKRWPTTAACKKWIHNNTTTTCYQLIQQLEKPLLLSISLFLTCAYNAPCWSLPWPPLFSAHSLHPETEIPNNEFRRFPQEFRRNSAGFQAYFRLSTSPFWDV